MLLIAFAQAEILTLPRKVYTALQYQTWIDGPYGYEITWQESRSPEYLAQSNLTGYLSAVR